MWRYFFSHQNKKLRWIFSISCGLYIVIFYRILQPAKNELIDYNYPLYYDAFAIVELFLLTALLSIAVPQFFTVYFDQKKWSFTKFNIWFLTLIIVLSIGSYIFDYYAHNLSKVPSHIGRYFIDYQFFVDLFTALPVYLLFLINQKPEINVTKSIDTSKTDLALNNTNIEPYSKITFIDQNQKTHIFKKDDFYYITSTGNYIIIFYKNEHGKIANTSLRSTLKSIEEQIQDYPYILRCHKAYIINTQKVTAITGNAKGYSFQLENLNELIPVSRSKNDFLKEQFKDFMH